MRKRLLFIMDTFPLGGIAKSLLSLWSELGDSYDIDFLLFKQEGLFLGSIPDNVCLLPEPIEGAFRNPHPKYVFCAVRELSLRRFAAWVRYSFRCTIARILHGQDTMVCVMDESIARLARPIGGHYDAGIAYQGGRCIYYLAEGVDADVKIGYVHNDYSASHVDNMMRQSDEAYFPLMNNICTVSPSCKESLQREFPGIAEKFVTIENICSPSMVLRMAEHGESYSDGWDGFRLATMARIDINQKGLDIAVSACRMLKDRNLRFRWYLLGDGEQRPQLENLVYESGVEDTFVILGARLNPYPYIKEADIYVQPSRFEGKSVALDEVKALAKPVVVTDFSTVTDQFEDGVTALFARQTPEDVANRIEELILSSEMRLLLSHNLSKEKVGNVEQARLFEDLLEEKTA